MLICIIRRELSNIISFTCNTHNYLFILLSHDIRGQYFRFSFFRKNNEQADKKVYLTFFLHFQAQFRRFTLNFFFKWLQNDGVRVKYINFSVKKDFYSEISLHKNNTELSDELFTDEYLRELFNEFDPKSTGFIDVHVFEKLLNSIGWVQNAKKVWIVFKALSDKVDFISNDERSRYRRQWANRRCWVYSICSNTTQWSTSASKNWTWGCSKGKFDLSQTHCL